MMSRITWGIFVIIINLTYLESSNFICNHTNEIYFTAPHTNCADYYQCRDGLKIEFECPLGSVFDFNKQRCIDSRIASACNEPTCEGKSNAFNADVTQGCHRFYQCFAGQIIKYENCKNGFLFNGSSCENAKNVRCEAVNVKHSKRSCNSHTMDDCQLLTDGLYPDESSKDCKSYIKCANGKTSHLRCPSSSVFHPTQGSCIPDVIYECPRSTRLERLCKGKTDGFHPDPRFGCSAFVKCQRGLPVHFDECVHGQFFDRKFCTYKSSVTCHHEARSAECMQLEMGYYQDRSFESSCRNYFFCYNGRKTTFSCPVGELFNGDSCVDDRFYKCSNLDADSCDTKDDGYYKDNNLDCRSYFFCSSNRKFSFLCKSGEAFDGHKCVSKRHLDTLCSLKSSECLGKSDGYYQDLKSGCTKYFYCKQSEKLQVLTCRNSRLFNGNSCVSTQTYTCPSIGHNQALKLNCVQRKCLQSSCSRDGFFADYDSRCKSYYFCVNGIQTKLSCSKNLVFNENEGICVSHERYQCPVYCSNECV